MSDSPLETTILTESPEDQLHQILRKAAHDLRSPLSIMAMGIEALRAMKFDPVQCEAMCDMMAREGVEAMKRIIEEMVERTEPR